MIIITTGEEEEEEEGEWAATTTLSVNFNQKVFFIRGETRERERERTCVLSLFFTSASPKIQPQSKSKN